MQSNRNRHIQISKSVLIFKVAIKFRASEKRVIIEELSFASNRQR